MQGSKLWVLYAVVYAAGFGGLMYLTRTSPLGWAALSLPFVFPLILVATGAFATSREPAAERPPNSEPISLLGGAIGAIHREPPRWTTVVAWTMVNPFIGSMFPADTATARVRLILLIWWLACAALTGFLLPRLIRVRT